ncbi:MAG: DUF177 domain-containing protein [Bacteroidales bacterium]
MFDYELNEEFFEHFPESGIRQPEVKIKLQMTKRERQIEFDFDLAGKVLLPCDRCLEDYEQEIDGQFKLYGKFGSGRSEEELDVVWITPEMYQLDLSQYLYEFVILSLPMRKVHPPRKGGKPGCDPEMLDLLNNLSVTK